MKKYFLSGSLSLFLASPFLHAADYKFGNQILKVPEGFEIELVSNTNLVQRPVSMDFDELGRLYVTDSSGSSEKGPTQYEKKDHRVMRLEDTNGDGKFDKSIVFADKMMFPEGCMYYDGSVYVAAPPSIWKLTDTNNDGIADVRVEWFDGKTLTGCANDLHGPYLGPDGWIYWTKGAFAEQTYTVNGKPFVTKASHIFRARPDGSGIEPVLTGGMDNPVSVAFSPEGERFLAGTFFEPQVPGHRDGVIHAIYGGVYGKPNAALDGHKRTGELMPVMIHSGPSAPASIISYRSKILGDDFQNNLFVANFNLHNVTRHILEPDGATFKTRDSVFLSCDNDPDFHPTHLLEDADGSILVIDTGGWYKICCPTSQLYKPDVFGAIYRIRKIGAKKIEDPRGLKIAWKKSKATDLVKYLDDKRPFVVTRAIHQLAEHKGESVSALDHASRNSKSEDARRNAVWALTQIDGAKAREAVRIALTNSAATVRQSALNSVGLNRDAEALHELGRIVNYESSSERREAATALGRIGNRKFSWALISALMDSTELSKPRDSVDRVLEHAVIYALIEIEYPNSLQSVLNKALQMLDGPFGVKTTSSKEEFEASWVNFSRIALIALDQMESGFLKPEQVTPFLLSGNSRLKETASWIIGHRPEWGDALAGFFREAIAKKNISTNEQVELQHQLAKLASNSAIQKLLADTLEGESTIARLIALRTMTESGLKQAPPSWTSAFVQLLHSKDANLIGETVLAAKAVPSAKENATELSAALSKLARDVSQPADVRLNALAALPANAPVDFELFDFLLANLDSSKSVATRSTAVSVLTRSKLTQEQFVALTETIKMVGPMESAKLLDAFEKTADEAVGLKLVTALSEAKTFNTLRVERLKPLFEKYPAPVQTQAETLYASLNVDAKKQSAHIDQLLASLKDGDIRRGQTIFNSETAACAACHAIGYLGGNLGPDLTKIGTVRTERDLIEAIVYPSASFVRSYEPIIVATKDGEDYSGVLKKDADDEIVLATGPGTEMKISRDDILEMRPGMVSVMPGGLDEQLSGQELADLIAFLKATRW